MLPLDLELDEGHQSGASARPFSSGRDLRFAGSGSGTGGGFLDGLTLTGKTDAMVVQTVVRRAIVTHHNRMESVGYRADRRQDLALNNNPDGVCGRRDCIRADSVITVQ